LVLLCGSAVAQDGDPGIVPIIECVNETISACQDGAFCFPTTVLEPGAGDLVFTIPNGVPAEIDPVTGELCISPVTGGDLEIEITATDAVGRYGRCTAVFSVEMGSAPELTLSADTTVHLCAPTEICLPVSVFDADDNLATVTSSMGEYADGSVCFTPYGSGVYEIEITATDDCGQATSDVIQVTVTNSQAVELICPTDQTVFACDLDTFCFPIEIVGMAEGMEYTVEVSGLNTWWDAENGEVCFFSECAFTNQITVDVTDACGTYSCSFEVVVGCNQPTQVVLPPDTTVGVCAEDGNVCVPVAINDPDGNLISVTVDGGVYDAATGLICVDDFTGDSHLITVMTEDECGDQTIDEMLLRVSNEPPVATCPVLDPITVCEFSEPICVDGFAFYDPDDNIASATVNGAPLIDGYFCFYATDGDNELELIVVDDCGLADTCVTIFTVNQNRPPTCSGPSDTTISVCEGDTVCLPLFVDDPDGNFDEWQIIYGGGEIVDGQFCYYADVPREQSFTIRAIDSCNAECELNFSINFDVNQVPEISDRYTGEKFCDPVDSRQVGVAFYDPDDDNLTFEIISGDGTIDNQGQITYHPIVDGVYTFEVAVFDECGSDTGILEDTITFNNPPELVTEDMKIYLCDVEEICFDVIGSDVDGDAIDIFQRFGPGVFETLTDSSGQTCFMPDEVDSATYVFGYCVVDPCDYVKNGVEPPACPPCEPDTVRVTVIIDRSPTLTCPDEQIITVCEPTEVCFDVEGDDPDGGPLTYVLIGDYDNVSIDGNTVCILADVTTSFDLRVQVSDTCGHTDDCVIPVTIDVNQAPEVFDRYTSEYFCDPIDMRQLQVDYNDPDGDNLTFEIISGDGTIDDQGQITYYPITDGVYTFQVAVFDECGSDTGILEDTIVFNDPPVLVTEDMTVYLCDVEEICFDVAGSDPNGDAIEIFQQFGPGWLEMLTDTSGQTCFMPEDVDSATYLFGYCVVDSCDYVNSGAEPSVCPPCDPDTVRVTVIIDRGPTLTCPDEQIITVCEPTEVCFDVQGEDPDGGPLTYELIGEYDNVTIDGNTVCIFADVTTSFDIHVQVSDTCGHTADCVIPVTMDVNQPPVVTAPEDFATNLCEPGLICFEVLSYDPDGNLTGSGANYGDFDGQQMCFWADTAGVYEIITWLSDECQQRDEDTILVTVTLEGSLTVDLGDDLTVALCEVQEICLDVAITGSPESVTTNIGTYDPATGQLCFVPEGEGDFILEVTASGICGSSVDSVTVTVDLNEPVVISEMSDTSVYLCYPTEICLPVTISDPDDNIVSIEVSHGTYADGQVCFIPYNGGTYEIIVTATDSCGFTATSSATVTVETDQGVSLTCPNDTTIFACELGQYCFPIDLSGIPEAATIEVNGVNVWYNADDSTVCFTAECGFTNPITVQIITPCDTVSCSFDVTIECNQPPVALLPPDTTIELCVPELICVPVAVSDPDGNLMDVTIDGHPELEFDPITSQVCFFGAESGDYEIIVNVTDSCGEVDSDIMIVSLVINTPPSIEFSSDTLIRICAGEVCVPIDISDIDGVETTVEVTTSFGSYDFADGTLCFYADTNGTYCIEVIATDSCGFADTLTACIPVELIAEVAIECPAEPIEIPSLCVPDNVCIPLNIIGEGYTVQADFGTVEDDILCFWADTSGTYRIAVSVEGPCNSDYCEIVAVVEIASGNLITCPGDSAVTLCHPETICFDYQVSPSVTDVTVTKPDGAYLEDGQVCVPVGQTGELLVELVAVSDCGTDTCEFTITSIINTPPVVTLDKDTTVRVCEPVEVCFPFTIEDAEDNIELVEVSVLPSGSVSMVDDQICFTPPDFGSYTITLRAVDSCDESSYDELVVNVIQGGLASMMWFGDPSYFICNPDSIHVLLGVSPPDALVEVSYGVFDPVTDLISFWADTTGVYTITVRAEAACGDTTDTFEILVIVGEEPTVSTVGQIDSLVCFGDPMEICFEAIINDPAAEVTLIDHPDHAAPDGASFANGEVCVTVSGPDTYGIGIAVYNECGGDTSWTVVNITADEMPELFLPAGPFVYNRCEDDEDIICIEGIFATDLEGIDSLVMRCGTGEFTNVRVDSGYVCLPLDIAFGLHEYCFVTYDGCHTDSGSFLVEIIERPDCDVCMTLSIEANYDNCVEVGIIKEVPVYVETEMYIGGFDLLIGYGASELTFRGVQMGEAISGDVSGWEYFQHRIVTTGAAGMPSGLVRFVGIADVNNGPVHPDHETLNPNGVLFIMEFLIANDQNLGDIYLPIQFVTLDCGDNAVSDTTGNNLFVDLRIWNPYDLESYRLVWDEQDDITYPESSRDLGTGTPDACFGTGKVDPIRCIEFFNGGICIIHPDSIDARGDLNLNGVAYEIADAVVFSNYFIYGLGVFTVNVAGQIAASDVNADGATLQVADLVLLIRVVIGDTPPIPKLFDHEEALIVSSRHENGEMSISTESSSDIGAGLFIFDLEGDVGIVEEPRLTDASSELDMIWSIQDGQLRVLVVSIGQGRIPAGAHDIIQIPYRGDGSITLNEVEIVDYYGQAYPTVLKGGSLPQEFSLSQNYPNPFNPTTTIGFSLPVASQWSLSIYNINGELVSDDGGNAAAGHHAVTWNGTNADGAPVASGVYFYRLETSDFIETRKMLLLK
jgi:hypothetical protein